MRSQPKVSGVFNNYIQNIAAERRQLLETFSLIETELQIPGSVSSKSKRSELGGFN